MGIDAGIDVGVDAGLVCAWSGTSSGVLCLGLGPSPGSGFGSRFG